MKKIISYKQTYYESCLIACSLMLTGHSAKTRKAQELEKQIFFEAEEKKFPFFIQSMLASISKHLDIKINLIVDNKYFANELNNGLRNYRNIVIDITKVNSVSAQKVFNTHGPLMCFIDGHHLGDYAHWPHYVIIEKANNTKFTIIDPNTAKRRNFSAEKLDLAISGLRDHLKICPFLIYFD